MALRDSDPAEVGGYRIEDRLGSGGMGVVYLARSASGRRLAVKVVHGQYADDDEFRTRFRREVAAARQVSGAFTAPVVDADADASRPWMATLYIPGADLGTHVRRHGPLPPDELRELAVGLAEALRDIHRAGVVHRDLKPANVMLADDGPRVIDFGVSRAADFAAADVLTQTGRVMGTPPFMSPEQFTSPHEVGPAADVFSLGAVLAYAATRRGPFDSPSPYETATKVVEGEPELDGVPEELLPFVRLCLEKHPKFRPSPDELLRFLRDGQLPERLPEPGEARTDAKATTKNNTRTITKTGTKAGAKTAFLRRRGRPRRRLWAGLAGGLVLAAASAVAVPLSDGGGGTPAPGALPADWRAWQAKDTDKSTGAGGSFRSCSALDGGLICAGDDIKAVRFSLATGKVAWSRTFDDHPDPDGGTDEGELIGSRNHLVFAVANKARDAATGGTDYAIQGIDTRTGALRWTWRTGTIDAPSAASGTAQLTSDGLLAMYGKRENTYALLDPATGHVRWRRSGPAKGRCEVRAAAGNGYLLCVDGNHKHTRVARLDAAGKPGWTVTLPGALTMAGQTGGRLVLLSSDVPDTPDYRRLTLLDATGATHREVDLDLVEPGGARPALLGGTLYFTLNSGQVRAVDPQNGRHLWDTASSVERPGRPAVSGTRLFISSPGGRLAVLDRRTGRELATSPARNTSADPLLTDSGITPTVHGDAVYVIYGTRSVYSVDVRNL